MIIRNIEKVALEYVKEFPVLAFIGARQSGKTTLIKSLFPKHKYYNLENLNDYNMLKEDPTVIIDASNPYIIIDEIQRIPDLISQIQAVVDEQKIMGSIIISGSQNILVSQSISQTLAGRAAYIEVPTLSQAEIKTIAHQDLYEAIFTGQYPSIYDRGMDPSRFYSQYVATYVERDVRLIKNITNLDAFRRFITLLAGRVGQVFNAQSISNDVGITQKTAKDWLSILKMSYLVFELKPYYVNIGKQLTKSSKVYFYDTGLLCNLLGVSHKKELEAHYLIGNIFENFIIADIIKEHMNLSDMRKFHFYRDKSGNEVDLIIKRGELFSAFEIKRGQTFTPSFLKGLKKWNTLPIENIKRTSISKVIYTGKSQSVGSAFSLVNWREATDSALDF